MLGPTVCEVGTFGQARGAWSHTEWFCLCLCRGDDTTGSLDAVGSLRCFCLAVSMLFLQFIVICLQLENFLPAHAGTYYRRYLIHGGRADGGIVLRGHFVGIP